MSLVSQLITVGLIVVVLALISFLLAKQYRKVGPNEVLIISGGRKRTVIEPDGTKRKIGYRYRVGGGTFVFPFIESVSTLPMEVIAMDIKTPEVHTHSGVPVMVTATAQVKIDSSDHSIRKAAEQFLGLGRDGIRDVSMTILEGKMRDVIGSMTVEDIYRNRHVFAQKVIELSTADFERMGLVILSFSLKDISDTQGYLDALGKPQIAAAKRDAAIAEAETEKEAIIKSSEARKEGEVARLEAEALIAKAQWENEAKKAESQTLVNQRKAQADYAYELERVRLSQEIKKEEAQVHLIEKEQAIKIEELEIARREKELEATVIKPANARKYQIIAEAEAEEKRAQAEARSKAELLKLEGEATAESIKQKGLAEAQSLLEKAKAWEKLNQAALLEMYIDKLPDLAKAVAEPLAKVDKIILVGGEKGPGASRITAQVAEVLAQMPDVVKSLTGVDLKEYLKEKMSPEKKDETED
ncbi:MAG TPA: flotillin [Candidatus Aminicenantes bacterium]|nr:flotillin [Candidatus Aminicenantes bacterium]